MEEKVYIIIVNYNCGKDIIECLNSLKNIEYKNYKIIIVDNGSKDDSLEMIRKNFNNVDIIENKCNLGFAGAINKGIMSIKEKDKYFVLLLNPDVIVKSDFLTKMVNASKQKNAGLLGAKIYFYNTNKIWCIGQRFSNGRAFKIKIPYIGIDMIGCGEEDFGQYDDNVAELLSGCCMLIKDEVIKKVGLFDELFFLFCEDTDYCIRSKKHGYKIYVEPKAIIWHKVSKTMVKDEFPTQYSYLTNKIAIYNLYRSNLLLIKKHFGVKNFAKALFAYLVKILTFNLIFLIKNKKMKLDIILPHLFGIIDVIIKRNKIRYI